jgi:hypothetical protein
MEKDFDNMGDRWLNPTNVIEIAKQLLQMDKESFEKDYQQDTLFHLANLEEILYQYILPKQQNKNYNNYFAIEKQERQLLQLIRYVQYIVSLLTPKKITQLRSDLVLDKELQETLG